MWFSWLAFLNLISIFVLKIAINIRPHGCTLFHLDCVLYALIEVVVLGSWVVVAFVTQIAYHVCDVFGNLSVTPKDSIYRKANSRKWAWVSCRQFIYTCFAVEFSNLINQFNADSGICFPLLYIKAPKSSNNFNWCRIIHKPQMVTMCVCVFVCFRI